MRSVRIHEFGNSDKISVEEIERPKLKTGEVLVKVLAAGVNPIDFKIREGYIPDKRLPLVMGQDFCGEILEVGKDVKGFEEGDKVFGFAKEGAYAEFTVASACDIARLPVGMDEETAAAIPTAGLTAWQIVVDEAKISENTRVLIHGAAGGVGSFAVQLCNWKEAYVIANAAKEDEEYLRTLGIDEFIDYHSEKFWEKAEDIDVVIDLVGGQTYQRSFDVVKAGGTVVTTLQEKGGEKEGVKVIRTMMRKNGKSLEHLADLVERGVINVRVDKTYPLQKAREAQDQIEFEHKQGKVVLKVA
ncbi:MAG: NADP-dependent oxidoreductase [Bacteriovoracia bacterium]